eukprot:3921532-Rhodomonas_salina.1
MDPLPVFESGEDGIQAQPVVGGNKDEGMERTGEATRDEIFIPIFDEREKQGDRTESEGAQREPSSLIGREPSLVSVEIEDTRAPVSEEDRDKDEAMRGSGGIQPDTPRAAFSPPPSGQSTSPQHSDRSEPRAGTDQQNKRRVGFDGTQAGLATHSRIMKRTAPLARLLMGEDADIEVKSQVPLTPITECSKISS